MTRIKIDSWKRAAEKGVGVLFDINALFPYFPAYAIDTPTGSAKLIAVGMEPQGLTSYVHSGCFPLEYATNMR